MSQEITINIKGPSELKLSITISLDKSVKDLKAAISEKSDVEAERQRLIYSGRVLKDDDPLSNYKIQTNHTIHMVKGVARSTDAPAAPQPLPTMQAGQNPADPLTQLNGPMGHGVMAGFNPFASMGLNANDPNMIQGMMDSPQFIQQMSNMMSNPAVMEQLMAADPNLRAMGPEFRQFFQSDQFRQMVSNPEALRGMFQMASAMRGPGSSPFGMPGAGAGGAGAAPNAFASLFAQAPSASGTTAASPSAASITTPSTGAAPSAGSAPPMNPFGAIDPTLIEQILAGGGGNPFGNAFNPFGAGQASQPSVPAGPPPEERFQVQLQQLSDMGFVNAQQNVRALLATGGNVQHAIEYILGGGGL